MIDPHPDPPPARPGPPRVPFPSLHPAERVRGSGILEELAGRHGALLWESYRNVGDWAVRPRPGRTGSMFGAGAAERRTRQIAESEWRDGDAGLRTALEAIRDLLAQPREARERTVAGACRRISAWAREQGALATEFYFAAAAGLCTPDDAAQAYHAGKLARDLARWDAAEAWLEHAMAAARRHRDRETQGVALLGLGNTFYRQGLYRRAGEAYAAGLLLARRHGLPDIEGGALHNLFVVAVETGDHAGAEEFARRALGAYGTGHPRVPELAHDVAYLWLVKGDSSRALQVLEALASRLHATVARVHALASLGRAAGESGARDVFERAWSEVSALVADPGAQSRVAAVLLEMALGAAGLGDLARAERIATSALASARHRGEVDVVERVELLLDTLRRGLPAREAVHAPRRCGASDLLAGELVDALRAGAGD